MYFYLSSYEFLSDIYGGKTQPELITNRKDTVRTAWFDIKDMKKLYFFGYGKTMQGMSMKIERNKDGKRFPVPMVFISDKQFTKHNYTLINGGNEKYRIVWVKNPDTLTYMSEEIVIGGLPDILDIDSPVDNSRFGRTIVKEQQEIIDLGDENNEFTASNKIRLVLYPNPASDALNVAAYFPASSYSDENRKSKIRQITIKAYTNAGLELFRQNITPGETISIPTVKYSQGVYFIRAEEKISGWDIEPLAPEIEPFVIER